MTADNKVVLYLRVSTKDKDQNPERQRSDLEKWCKQHGVQTCGHIVDEGTSATKTNPFERPAFCEAVAIVSEASARHFREMAAKARALLPRGGWAA